LTADILAFECNRDRDNGHDWKPDGYAVRDDYRVPVARYICRRCGARKGEIAGVRCWYVGPEKAKHDQSSQR
jgi:hypothetical protein